MRRKRGVLVVGVLFVFLGVLLSGVGSGQVSCNTDQIILRLSQDTNAQGAWYGEGSYLTKICYKDIFRVDYPVTNNPEAHRTCTGNNIVLRLSDPSNTPTNSHAEGPQGNGLNGASGTTNYNAQICFGDLKCEMIDDNSGVGCGVDKKPVVRLFDRTNAHLQIVTPPVGVAPYRYLICCSTGALPPSPPQEAYWASDPAGTTGMVENALINSMSTTVYLVAKGVTPNEQATFTIKDKDNSPDTDDEITTSLTARADTNGKAIMSWTPNGDADIYLPAINTAFTNEDDSSFDGDSKPDLDLFFTATDPAGYSQESGIILLNQPQQGGIGCDWYNNPTNVDGIDGTTGNSQPTQSDACNKDKESGRNYYNDDITKYNQLGCDQIGRTCFCEWKNNKCDLAFSDPPITQNDGSLCNRKCSVTTSYGDCDINNERKLTIKGTYITSGCDPTKMTPGQIDDFNNGRQECEAEQEETVSCLAPTINVPFFGGWQFMISVFGIVGIYFLVAWRERRLRRNG